MLHDITRGDHFFTFFKLVSMSDTDYNTNGTSVLEKFNMYWAAVENI